MLERVISGGQTGADQAAWRAARRHPHRGLDAPGFQTEDGPRPEFARQFRAEEHPSDRVPDLRTTPDNARVENAARTVSNVLAADGTLIFASDPPVWFRAGWQACAGLVSGSWKSRVASLHGEPTSTTATPSSGSSTLRRWGLETGDAARY